MYNFVIGCLRKYYPQSYTDFPKVDVTFINSTVDFMRKCFQC